MTIREAIERIKWRKWTASQMVGMGEDGKAFEDMEIAIEAMEKQDAKNVIKIFDDSVKTYWCKCPCCSKGIGWISAHHSKYCDECGQKLDWGD